MAKFLKEERKKMRLSQAYISEKTGVSMTTQSNYETGKRSPDSQYLLRIAELGFDVNFVLTGKRDENHLSIEEKYLLELFRQADDSVKKHVIAGLMTGGDNGQASKGSVTQLASGNGNLMIGGDVGK